MLGELKHCSGEITAFPGESEGEDDNESFSEDSGELLLMPLVFC